VVSGWFDHNPLDFSTLTPLHAIQHVLVPSSPAHLLNLSRPNQDVLRRNTFMSYKDKTAVSQLFELLESRYALRVLWALRDGHPQTFRLLQDSVGGVTPNTLNTRLKELRAANLIEHGGNGYGLTKTGLDLLKRLNDLQAFSNKWVQAQTKAAEAATLANPAA
jgi:DNA-binding HxlR family transcriptional regulator